MNKVVSIIIPTYDRSKTLRDVIGSYIKQKGVGELIIIDDGSMSSYSDTIAYIDAETKKKNIIFKYVKNGTNMGAGYCRNLGVTMASCDYILWGEDDAFLSDDYLLILKRKCNEKTIVFGSIYYGITPQMEKNSIVKTIMQQKDVDKPIFNFNVFEGYYRKNVRNDQEVPFGHALILVPKKAYENITYYENYKVNGYREESDAQVQMVKKGYKIIYTSETSCFHFPWTATQTGGQHKNSTLKTELYTIKNTFIFYDRHYKFFRDKYNLKRTLCGAKFYFASNRILKNMYALYLGFKRKIYK